MPIKVAILAGLVTIDINKGEPLWAAFGEWDDSKSALMAAPICEFCYPSDESYMIGTLKDIENQKKGQNKMTAMEQSNP